MDEAKPKRSAAATETSDPDRDAPEPVAQVSISTRSMWRAVGVVLLTLAGLWALDQMRSLLSMLVLAMFLALALVPGVDRLHKRFGWKRGVAVFVIYLAGLLFLVLMIVVLIPAISQLASSIGNSGAKWLGNVNKWVEDTFGVQLISAEASKDAAVSSEDLLKQWSGKILPAAADIATKGISFFFSLFTIATFAFYFAAGFPGLRRGFLSWFSPASQQRLGWTIDQSITQVGGYLYSRLLLTLINGLGFFATMVAVGMPVQLAIPLAVFGGFVSEFIPNIGTYIGGAIPILLTLALQGLVPALVVLGYTIIYQQIENYVLSPKISAKTMDLNGGLAFGSALAGGAMFGPLGAFLALPVAALIYSFISNYRNSHEVVYRSAYEEDEGQVVTDVERSEDG